MVVTKQGRIGRSKPQNERAGENKHRRPLQESREEREAFGFSSLPHIVYAGWQVSSKEADEKKRRPDVLEAQRPEEVCKSDPIRHGLVPDLWPVNARKKHDRGRDHQAFGRSVEVAEVQRVGMICLPRGEEHGQCGYEGGQSTYSGCAKSHRRRLEQ